MGSVLLERDRELRGIQSFLHEVAGGRGSTLVVQGLPGLGKSRLLQDGTADTDAHGVRLIGRFSCGELEREYPWSAALGLLTSVTAHLSSADRRELFSGSAAPAQRLLEDPARSAANLDPFSVTHGLYVVYERIARITPLLLVLDDAHWSDLQSLQQLGYLGRRLPQIAAGLIIAARPLSGDEEQRDVLDAVIAAATRTLQLSALSPPAVGVMVRGEAFPDASDQLCATCARLTGGNPFLLRELLIGLQSGDVDPESSLDQLLEVPPDTITRSVLARLKRATPTAFALARAVAVLDDGSTLGNAAALAGVDMSDAVLDADALTASEIFAAGEPLRFVHPLVRSAIYADIPQARRAAAHARAAELLQAAGAAPELVALHLLQAPPTGSAHTVQRLQMAARSAGRRGAPAAAARFLARALQEARTDSERADIMVELADAESRAGDPAAVEHLRAALALTPRAVHARILLALGWAEHHAGHFSDAGDAFQRGLRVVPQAQPELAAELEAGYVQSASLDTSRAADAAIRIRAIEEAAPALATPAQRVLLAQVLFARTVSGRDRDGLTTLAMRLWDGGRLLDEEGADSQTVWHVVGALSWADAYEDAYRIIAETLKTAEAEGAALAYARGCYARAWPHLWTGRIAEAADDARTAISIWHGGLETYLPAAIYWLVLAELERADLSAAQAAQALAGPAQRWQHTGMGGFHVAAEGHIATHRGDAAHALACHLRCGELMGELNVLNPSVMPWRSQAATAAALLGDLDLAQRLAAEELALARAVGSPRATGVALRVWGRLASTAQARTALEESVRVLEGSGATLEYARSVVELGAALRREGQRRSSRGLLQRGMELAERAGSVTLAREAAGELDAAGGHPPGRPAGGQDALTASERRVCRFAAEGHSNRYIAGRLAISVKAVEWHLSRSYRKLGISSRRQLSTVLDDARDDGRSSADVPLSG